jgi:hypothetical protein
MTDENINLLNDLPLHTRFTNSGSDYIKSLIPCYNSFSETYDYHEYRNNKYFNFEFKSKSHIAKMKESVDYYLTKKSA